MIQSKFILNIIQHLIKLDVEGHSADKQLPFLKEKSFEYTPGGCFVHFEHIEGIKQYSVEKPNLVLNGIKISSQDLLIEAAAILFFKDGLIDYLEIWCYLGDYPTLELTDYILTHSI